MLFGTGLMSTCSSFDRAKDFDSIATTDTTDSDSRSGSIGYGEFIN